MRTEVRIQNTEYRIQTKSGKGLIFSLGLSSVLCLLGSVCLSSVLCVLLSVFCLASEVSAQDDSIKLVETKRLELKEKEETLKREEERVNALRKDVEEKIGNYSQLLARIERALKKIDQVKDEKILNVVKAYESMPAEDAAARISALDDDTALLILLKMKAKKAGAVMALIEPRKAAYLTRSMTSLLVEK